MFLTSEHQYMYLSSSTVKELAYYDVDLQDFLPAEIIPDFQKRIQSMKIQGGSTMHDNGIEELITKLYDMVQDARSLPLGADKCIVERDKVLDMLDEISNQLPRELKQAKTHCGFPQ